MQPINITQQWDPRATDQTQVVCPCTHCGGTTQLLVSTFLLKQHRDGANIQDVWPHIAPSQREAMITGYHSACFDDMFKDMDDE